MVYLVVGRGTAALAAPQAGRPPAGLGAAGQRLRPAPDPPGPVVFVAGGIGQTPFLALGRWWLGRADYGGRGAGPGRATAATLLYGVRTAALAAGRRRLPRPRASPSSWRPTTARPATTGSSPTCSPAASSAASGPRGSSAAALPRCSPRWRGWPRGHEIACDVSLENHMACGFGACFSCVAPIRQPDGSTDLRRVCVEGPVFPAADVDWSGRRH